MRLSSTAKLAAILIALTAWAALAAQFIVSLDETNGPAQALWVLARYFTILTNLLVALLFSFMAVRGKGFGPSWLGGLTLWILIVGIVYHTLLARLYDPQGLNWWSDHGLHTAVPVLTALWWLIFAPKRGLGVRQAAYWMLWPLIYVIYALARGATDGIYPYYFIDAATLGYARVALNALGLSLGFFLGGLMIVGLGKVLSR